MTFTAWNATYSVACNQSERQASELRDLPGVAGCVELRADPRLSKRDGAQRGSRTGVPIVQVGFAGVSLVPLDTAREHAVIGLPRALDFNRVPGLQRDTRCILELRRRVRLHERRAHSKR